MKEDDVVTTDRSSDYIFYKTMNEFCYYCIGVIEMLYVELRMVSDCKYMKIV